MKTLKQIVEEKVKEFEELDIAWDGKNLKEFMHAMDKAQIHFFRTSLLSAYEAGRESMRNEIQEAYKKGFVDSQRYK